MTQMPIEATLDVVVDSLLPGLGFADGGMRSADIFELGANSMLAVRLVAKIKRQLDVTISVRDVFTGRSIDAIAERLREDVHR
jgi:acyl carrier protein